MMPRKPSGSFAPHEFQQFILPVTITIVGIMMGLIVGSVIDKYPFKAELIVYACVVITGGILNSIVLVRSPNFRETYGWPNAILSAVGLGLLPYILPDNLDEISHILIPIGIVAVAVVSGRVYAYATLLIIFMMDLPHVLGVVGPAESIVDFGVPYVVSLVTMEAILRIKDTTQEHIQRLETINKVSRQIMLSLHTDRTIALLDATFQDVLEADTYFIGILRDNEIHLDLFYDEGEYFNGTKAPLEGTLSGWVIKNQKELFLPDLSQEVELEGVKNFIRGKEKTSLSWMGVPLKAENVTGVIALGSYHSNAFDSADMELLSNLA